MPPRKRKAAAAPATNKARPAAASVAAELCAVAVADRLHAAALPVTPSLAQADSVLAQWSEQDAGPTPRGGALAQRQPSMALRPAAAAPAELAPQHSLRAALSFAAARAAELQNAPPPQDAPPAPPARRGQAAAAKARAALLEAHLAKLGLRRELCATDGNCQFRALALLLLGDAELHAQTRAAAVAALRASAERYAPLFASPAAFSKYCNDMARTRTWGDELTLAAAADAYAVRVHAVQSTERNWHLSYEPQPLPAGVQLPPPPPEAPAGKLRRVFLAYTSPVHYDAIGLA